MQGGQRTDRNHGSVLLWRLAQEGILCLAGEGVVPSDAWIASEPITHPDADVPAALLLPGYDESILGYADRSGCIDPRHFKRIVPGGNGVFQGNPCELHFGPVQ